MPAYNAAATILESINSVTAQTYQNWELIIIDDGSTDDTYDIVRKAAIAAAPAKEDLRVRLITNGKNLGVASSRNIGLSQALGEWVAFLDSDDLWMSTKLERQLIFAEQTGAAITYTATAYIDRNGNPKSYVLPAKHELNLSGLLRRNIMTCSSVMVRKEHMQPFPEGFLHEDYAAWIGMVRKAGRAYGLNEPLTGYRISDTSRSYNRLRSGMMNFSTYRHVGYSAFTAACMSARYAAHSITKRLRIWYG